MDIAGQKEKLNSKITLFTWIGGISAVIALVPLAWAATQVFGNHLFFKENELGDFIGGTSGTFASFAGLAFVYVAFLGQRLQILMQQEELELNRKELQDTREEIKGQKEQLELQNKQFQIQSFENVFFHLIDYFRNNSQQNFSVGYGDEPLIEKLNAFVNYQRNSYSIESWEKFNKEEKISSLGVSFNRSLKKGFARVKSMVEATLAVLIHLDKNREKIDHKYYLRVFLGSLIIHEQRVIFYSFFSSGIQISDDEKDLLCEFLFGFDVSNLIYRNDLLLLE